MEGDFDEVFPGRFGQRVKWRASLVEIFDHFVKPKIEIS
jgi:hypothetical protein